MFLSGITLIKRILSQSGAKAQTPVVNTPAPVDQTKYRMLEDQISKLTTQINALTIKQNQATVAPTPAAVPDPLTAPLIPPIPFIKLRPKKGTSIWLVGKSEVADVADLEVALKNAIDGDTIMLEEGIYELNFQHIKAKKVVISALTSANLIYKHTPQDLAFNDLSISNIDFTFSDHLQDFISFSAREIKFNFNNVKMSHPKLTLSFRDKSDVSFENSQLSGIALRVSGKSKIKLKSSVLEKAPTLLTLADEAEAEIETTIFKDFANVAMTSDSDQVKLKGERITVGGGLYAFWGKFNPVNAQVKDSKFHNLQEFTLTGTTINCSLCEKYDIKR